MSSWYVHYSIFLYDYIIQYLGNLKDESLFIIIILDAKGFVFDSATAVQTIAKDPTWEDMVIFK